MTSIIISLLRHSLLMGGHGVEEEQVLATLPFPHQNGRGLEDFLCWNFLGRRWGLNFFEGGKIGKRVETEEFQKAFVVP